MHLLWNKMWKTSFYVKVCLWFHHPLSLQAWKPSHKNVFIRELKRERQLQWLYYKHSTPLYPKHFKPTYTVRGSLLLNHKRNELISLQPLIESIKSIWWLEYAYLDVPFTVAAFFQATAEQHCTILCYYLSFACG